jgi:hypothetical protein
LPFYGAILACGLMVELHRLGREQRPRVTVDVETADATPAGS